MRNAIASSLWGAMLPVVVVAFLVAAYDGTAVGFTPESPEVKQALGKAIKFLESNARTEGRLGGKALVGMALLKYEAPPDHPLIQKAAKDIQDKLGEMDPEQIHFEELYSPGLCIIFLVNLDPSEYHEEIECLLAWMRLNQKPHGGWGYPNKDTGDTSMTQYGVLSCWEAMEAGFAVETAMVERVAVWLLKTQDPNGGFGYQGKVSGSFAPIRQSGVKHSMAAAGLGSVYMCSDMLGLVVRSDEEDDGLPAALQEVKERDPEKKAPKPKTDLDARLFRDVQGRGNRWFTLNYRIDPSGWTYYYMYALERYMSFRELGEGRAAKEPVWYNDGVKFLVGTQAENGSWESQAKPVADTAFGALFLMRSTKKSIEKAKGFGDGTMWVGRELPKESAGAELRGGNVVAKPLLGPAEQLLAVLESPDAAAFDETAVDLLAELPSQEAKEIVGKHLVKLRLLAADRLPDARLAAVRALAKTRDFDNVPVLIYGLTDDDLPVMLAARDALRRLSRRPKGFGLPSQPSDTDRYVAIEAWKKWYLAVRPDAEFED